MANVLDIFNNAAFDVISMSQAIEHLPEQPGKLGDMGIFEDEPITTTTATIEEKYGVLSLVQSQPRGSRANETRHEKRTIRAVPVPHLPEFDVVLADALQGIRAFGEADVTQQVATVVNNRLMNMKRNLDATREWQRVGALQGIVLDADGTTQLANLFTLFGVSQRTAAMDFSATPSTPVKSQITAFRRLIEHGMGGSPWTGINVVCGDNFWDAFISNKAIETAYANWSSNIVLQTLQRGGFQFCDCTWWNYSTKLGTTFLIPADLAFAFPTGAPGLFKQFLSPADYIETVNTPGQAYYAKQERMKFDKGIELEAQTNCLNICTRPANVIKLTFTS
jgi:hypothetical protein